MNRLLPWVCALSLLGLATWTSLPAQETARIPKAVKGQGWGSIKGQVVFSGSQVPKAEELKVDKNQEHCLQKGPILSRVWTVNPQTKGVRYVVVFLKPDQSQTLPISPDALAQKQGNVVLDQPMCHFEPHILAMYQGQKLVVKNPAPVAHNIVITGFKNSHNIQMGPNAEDLSFTLSPENNPIGLSCGAHPWMKGFLWVFAHPYFAVTDENGNFEIKNVPEGAQNLVVWHEAKGYVSGRNGQKINVQAGGVADAGKIELSP